MTPCLDQSLVPGKVPQVGREKRRLFPTALTQHRDVSAPVLEDL